ncbi:uncharacterized protein LOC132703550 [Cylas formicarius]|uniref:uncharacterized protein LOC132703550 n=1 Tax=Cylas formicarius TaxID=197179 RepID=UPI002958A80C|nr:uncharacterized protein LOC132703550 [Cylas formicarius]
MKRKHSSANKGSQKDLLDQFSPLNVGKIIPVHKSPPDVVRPPKATKLDQQISETFLKLQKGDFKLNLKETVAVYKPTKPCKLKTKRKKLVGRGPADLQFVDEIWREKQAQLQNELHQHFNENVGQIRRLRNEEGKRHHAIAQNVVGPDWFMELNTNQLNAVEQLQKAINEDLEVKSIESTMDVLANLGLVLRPNRKNVHFALDRSCGLPVKFLLVLYQITNPNRRSYSTNDRLLLSAVAHLTITETLRELHIRIPSPPRTREAIKSITTQRFRPKLYESPYLQPLSYFPPPPKYSGIYKNKHLQYPQSLYFSYLQGLILDRMNQQNKHLPTTLEQQNFVDYMKANDFYSRLDGAETLPHLLPPTTISRCANVNQDSPKLSKLPVFGYQHCRCGDGRESRPNKKHFGHVQNALDDVCVCNNCLEKKELDFTVRIIGRLTEAHSQPGTMVPLIQGITLGRARSYLLTYRNRVLASKAIRNLSENYSTHVVGGISWSQLGPVFNILSTLGEKECHCSEISDKVKRIADRQYPLTTGNVKYAIGGVKETEQGPVYILSTVILKQPCKCLEIYRNKLILKGTQNQLVDGDTKFVIGSLVETHLGPVYHVAGTLAQRHSNFSTHKVSSKIFASCGNKSNSDTAFPSIVSSSSRQSFVTKSYCKLKLENFMKHQCECEKCSKSLQKYVTPVLGGLTENQTNIVQGIYQPMCSCLVDHLNKIKKMQEYRLRIKLRHKMRMEGTMFQISGVKNTVYGPVYLISGISPPEQCQCANNNLKGGGMEEETQTPRAKMPPTGRIKYEISGVKVVPGENVYIISGALPVSDCECMQLLKRFESCHKVCLEEYDLFLKKINEETRLYAEESKSSTNSLKDAEAMAPNLESDAEASTIKSLSDVSKATSESESFRSMTPVENDEGFLVNQSEIHPINLPKDTPTPDFFLSRQFAIFKEFPINRELQRKALKFILSGMAADGFPLAKLPECHKLPIFRIWLKMRSGGYWTQSDIFRYCQRSKWLWRHTDLCHRQPRMVRMPFDASQAGLMTWKDANLIKGIAADRIETYYRRLKKTTINTGREFFGTTFSYEFPNRTFRNCAFAYIPTKEEAVFGYKIVQQFDSRIPHKKFPCYC